MGISCDEKIALCALNKTFGYEPRVGLELIRHAGGAANVYGMDRDSLRKIMGNAPKRIEQISSAALDEAAEELDKIAGCGARFLGITEPDYPTLLKECPDPPIGLYVKSVSTDHDLFCAGRKGVGVVGTRDMTSYGEEWCGKMVNAMGKAAAKPCIVSGLAIGVDVTAHVSALRSGLPTIAVLPTGIDKIYPFRHGWIADKISASPASALVTDYPTGTAPIAINFIRRNRIIAGLSDALVVVESKIKGGAMMTARLANSYDRAIYALPGRVDDLRSQGCNLLLRERLADAITGAEDLVERLGMGHVNTAKEMDLDDVIAGIYAGKEKPARIAALTNVAKLVRDNRGISIDGLSSALGLDHPDVMLLAEMLECDGIISIDLLRRCSLNSKNR